MWNDVGDNLSNILVSFVEWIPKLVGAILILIIGWIVAVVIKSLVIRLLKGIGFNRWVEETSAENFVQRITDDPSQTIGQFFYWLIWIITWTIAITALRIPILTDLIEGIYGYVPNILAAIVVLVIALALSGAASSLILRWMKDTATGRILATVIPIIILSISAFAILEQLGIAPVVITATYIAIIGSLSLGFAIAFGLGGRDAAKNLLDQAYEKGTASYGKIKRDFEKGGERAKEDVDRAKDKYRS